MNAKLVARRLAITALILTGALEPQSAAAYTRGVSNWNPASIPIPYRINLASAPASIGTAGAQSTVDNGFASWAAPACTRWRSMNAGTTALTRARAGDRENSILWITSAWPAELGDVNTTIGVTTPVWTSGGYFIDADIQFNAVGFTWNMTGTRPGVDTQSIATHEQGHFLGLNHSASSAAVMYASYSGGIKRTLTTDDVSGVCAIYPNGTPAPDAGMTMMGTGAVGDRCSATAACATGNRCVCRDAAMADCFCTRPCSTSTPCPTSFTCADTMSALGFLCIPGGGTMAGGTGDPCTTGAECMSGICARGPTGSPFCSQVCTDDCTCPSSYTCVATMTSGTSVCAPGANACVPVSDAGIQPQTDSGTPIMDSGPVTTDSGPSANDEGPTGDTGTTAPGGCGCRTAARSGGEARLSLLAMLSAAAVISRRRRARRSGRAPG